MIPVFSSLLSLEFPSDLEVLDLSYNQFTSVPPVSQFKNLRKVIFDGNPIKSVTEFNFNGDDSQLEVLTDISFESCEYLDYVDDAAFAFLKSLSNVSFKGSGIFYLSKSAFYECPSITTVDVSDTKLKYVDSSFFIYADTIRSFIVSDMECSCINDWMLETNGIVSGYDCNKADVDIHNCPPQSLMDGYIFNFQEDTSNTAIVSVNRNDTNINLPLPE